MGKLAAAQQQAAQVRLLLPGVIKARNLLGEAAQQLQACTDALWIRKEVLEASCIAAHSSFLVGETIAASGLIGDDGGQEDK